MTKAEERALEAYPYSKGRAVVTGFGTIEFDQNHDERVGFVEGYKQAEQDLMEKVCKWIEDNFSLYEGISGYHVAKELKQSMKDE